MVAFVCLNPSTADAERDDPTVRRLIDFARRWGFAELALVNLYAYRATDPTELARVPDPIGPDNDRVIAQTVRAADLVVCAWGNLGLGTDRALRVLQLVAYPRCLGLTKAGAPRHPLYVPASARHVPYRLDGASA